MAAEPALEPNLAQEEEGEYDEGEESDVYELEGEEEGDAYQPEEDEEDEDAYEEAYPPGPDNLTAELLGNKNGATEQYGEEEDDEDDEYHDDDDDEGTAENLTDLSSSVAGSKRGVDELAQGDADEEGDEDGGETVSKKARV